jgi:hypothetical protein
MGDDDLKISSAGICLCAGLHAAAIYDTKDVHIVYSKMDQLMSKGGSELGCKY